MLCVERDWCCMLSWAGVVLRGAVCYVERGRCCVLRRAGVVC